MGSAVRLRERVVGTKFHERIPRAGYITGESHPNGEFKSLALVYPQITGLLAQS